MDENVNPVVEKLAQAQRLYEQHKMRPSFDSLVESIFLLSKQVHHLTSVTRQLTGILNELGEKARQSLEVEE